MLEHITTIIIAIAAIVGCATVASLSKALRSVILQVLPNITANVGKEGFTLKLNDTERKAITDATVQVTKESVEKGIEKGVANAMYTLHYGKYMPNYEAYENAVKKVLEYLEEKKADKEALVDIKITAVGMAYSWSAFLSHLSNWLDEHRLCQFNIQILLVDPDYIDRMPIADSPKDWAKQSRDRVSDIEKMMEASTQQKRERVSCAIRICEEIPQYHGILVNDEHLFLGRTDWIFTLCAEGKKPQLTVGENKYRYFHKPTDVDQDKGAERVGLFSNWHKYRWEYRGKLLIDFQKGIKQSVGKNGSNQ